MPSPSPEAFAEAEAWRLARTERARRGAAGSRLGAGTGSSLEFQDRRAYAPGDDVRHLDWRAFARTDELLVRVYREEIQPRVELVVDTSRSMAVSADKARVLVDLTVFLARCARAEGQHVTVLALGDAPRVVAPDELDERGLELDARTPLAAALEAARPLLRPAAQRLVLSDFLSPFDASALVRTLAARAGPLTLLQLLDRSDVEPPRGRALRLVDAETDRTVDLVLDPDTVARYVERRERLTAELARECRRATGTFVELTCERALDELVRGELAPARVVEPA